MVLGLAVALALTVGVASEALAGKNSGVPTLKLGVQNTVSAVTSMVGSVAGPALKLDNNGAGPALDLQVEPGKAPMTVNSDQKVDNLNADKVDGLSAEQLQGQQGPEGPQGPQGPAGPSNPNAQNADRLDGKDSSEFARAYARTVVVSPAGSPTESGAALKNALSGINGASQGTPTY